MATRQIRRLLIANRGEIAIRIARTARDRGISCVGVYSDADSTSLHLDSMDVAVALGGETAAESYLRIDAIVDAAVANGCDAVHPGYGFLAENAEAARAVEAAGLMWVGPTAEQIELLGDKMAAKRAAEEQVFRRLRLLKLQPMAALRRRIDASIGESGCRWWRPGMRIVEG